MSMYAEKCSPQESMRKTDAEKVFKELQELISKAECVLAASSKLHKIIQDRPASPVVEGKKRREQYAPLWMEFSCAIAQVSDTLSSVEQRLNDAEI